MAVQLGYAPTPHNHYYNQHSQAPPSPPMEESRCSLPSISNLLGLADAGSPTTDPSPTSYRGSPQSEGMRCRTARTVVWTVADFKKAPLSFPQAQNRRESGGVSSRPCSRHSAALQHRRSLPPTPPLSTDTVYDSYSSPSSQPRSHFPFDSKSSSRYYETTPPLEAEMHNRHQSQPAPRLSVPVPPPHQQPFAQAAPAYYNTPSQGSVLGPAQPISQYNQQQQQQQQLPRAFPPHPAQDSQQLWQHHHYLHPSQSSVYPQSQDKYLCPTCNKAFSRPSSLRIHSHSHTGEKPYKCAHPGCGKAFSVRSNMKRHERGCHSMSSLGSRSMV